MTLGQSGSDRAAAERTLVLHSAGDLGGKLKQFLGGHSRQFIITGDHFMEMAYFAII